MVFSERVVGCDASWTEAGISGGEGTCGAGWEICASQAAAAANGLTQEGCGSQPGAGTFYGSYESGPSVLVGNAWVCFDDGPGQSDGTNNIYGYLHQ